MKNTNTSPYTILFENEKVLAVNKPAGILVIPDQYTPREETLAGKVSQDAGRKLFVVHRIDRDTTGVVIFAKDAEAHAFLSRQFEGGDVEKKYLALLNGQVMDNDGHIDVPIRVEGRNVSTGSEGKESLTDYTVRERFRDFTLVEARPKTGRRHQIRVHFASLGHPLAVDPEHGGRTALCLSEFKKKYKVTGTEKPLMSRLSLHAASAAFTDPVSRNRVTVEAPLPEDFEITLKQLRKHDR